MATSKANEQQTEKQRNPASEQPATEQRRHRAKQNQRQPGN
jgi:hypothetical protein